MIIFDDDDDDDGDDINCKDEQIDYELFYIYKYCIWYAVV